jgi:Flp pilus assembly pilin Flp
MATLVSKVLVFARRKEEAATVAEYCLLMLLIVSVAIVGVGAFGGSVQGLYNTFLQATP